MDKQARIIVKGKVQGVFFRDHTQRKARELRLKGTVRNLADGRVEIYAGGGEKELAELSEWCREGSPYSRVDQVTVEELEKILELPPFKIVYSKMF